MALKQMEAKKVTVGENSFHIKPFPAFKAANLTGELASVLSPLIGAIAPLVGDRLEALMKKLLLGGNIVIEYEDEEGERQQDVLDKDLADEVFCGNVQDMFVLCVHVIKLNFNGFFEKLATLSGKAEQVATKTPRKIL